MKENLMVVVEVVVVVVGEVLEKELIFIVFIRKIRKKGCLEKE